MPEESTLKQGGPARGGRGFSLSIRNLSLGEKIIAIGAIAGIVSFFLTWFSNPKKFAETMDVSKKITGTDIGSWAYLVPVLMVVSLGILYISLSKGPKSKIKLSSYQILIGAVLVTLGITIKTALSNIKEWYSDQVVGETPALAVEELTEELDKVYHTEIGVWLFVLGALAIIIGALLIQRAKLKE